MNVIVSVAFENVPLARSRSDDRIRFYAVVLDNAVGARSAVARHHGRSICRSAGMQDSMLIYYRLSYPAETNETNAVAVTLE